MIALPAHGFVVLSMPKCASTSLVESLSGQAEVVFRYNPRLKHLNCQQFHNRMVPLLRHGGYKRRDYEVVSLFREPVAWLESWYRYRLRPALDGSARSTADLSFEDFATAYVEGDRGTTGIRGRPSQFIARDDSGAIGVDRLFALERPDTWQAWIKDRMGEAYTVREANVSDARDEPELSPGLRERLVAHFTPEYDVYRHLTDTGEWVPPKGYVPGG